ncbi:SOS response-associated peptidase family protein [Glaciihabitans sp. UYNi722]|uniref:SOS response-associated peptidase family protein n=1 Tax=Glaciihabitans sp. UYNi722 TaxID=3156344 RepID=UPI00339A6F9B
MQTGALCGRHAIDDKTNAEIEAYDEAGGKAENWVTSDWQPGWNITPTDRVQIVRKRHDMLESNLVRWAMVPPSAPAFGAGKPIINARIETAPATQSDTPEPCRRTRNRVRRG